MNYKNFLVKITLNKLLILLIITIVSGCVSSPTENKPPIFLSIQTIKGGVEFIKRSAMGVFAVTEDGHHYEYAICNDIENEQTCINNEKYATLLACEEKNKKPCELIAINDQIVYPGEVDIMNKKFTRGDRINYFTVPLLRDADKFMNSGTVEVESLPDIFADDE